MPDPKTVKIIATFSMNEGKANANTSPSMTKTIEAILGDVWALIFFGLCFLTWAARLSQHRRQTFVLFWILQWLVFSVLPADGRGGLPMTVRIRTTSSKAVMVTSHATAPCDPAQQKALNEFFGSLKPSNVSDCCQWPGITCAENGDVIKVWSLGNSLAP